MILKLEKVGTDIFPTVNVGKSLVIKARTAECGINSCKVLRLHPTYSRKVQPKHATLAYRPLAQASRNLRPRGLSRSFGVAIRNTKSNNQGAIRL